MRTLKIAVILIVNAIILKSYSASAVAFNKATGAYGYAYGKKTIEEAKKIAAENCPGGGEIIASSAKDGYGAVLRTVNNWKTEGQTITVVGLVAQTDPAATRKQGTGDCATCQIVEIWYDNATSNDKEKYEGSGGKKGPEVLKPDFNRKSFNNEFQDFKVVDGREFLNGYGINYLSSETKTVMKDKVEYYMSLRDGQLLDYNYVEGQDIIVEVEYFYKDGVRRYEKRFGPTGAITEYVEFRETLSDKGYVVTDGAYYNYDYKGNLLEKGRNKNDKKHGMSFIYDSKGLLKESGMYDFGNKEGEWITYAPDGKTVKKKQVYARGIEIK